MLPTNDDRPLNCNIKKPTLITEGDIFQSGCSVIDITFPNIISPEIGEIQFKNYYTSHIAVKYKTKDKNGKAAWSTALAYMQLMPKPHSETHAEDYFTIQQHQFEEGLQNVGSLRMILYQPSPVWKTFTIDNIKLYKPSAKVDIKMSLPEWLGDLSAGDGKEEQPSIKGVAPVEAVSAGVQQLWSLAAKATENRSSTSLGRFDVDDSYEINLLSYT